MSQPYNSPVVKESYFWELVSCAEMVKSLKSERMSGEGLGIEELDL